MSTHPDHAKTCTGRRAWLALTGLVGMAWLSGCKAQDISPPKPPYGQALDVSRVNTFVAFDFRIDKADRFDVVLEIFKKDPKERVPDEVWDMPNAHFKVRIESLGPSGELIVEKDVQKTKEPYGLFGKSGFSSSRTEKTDLMSFKNFIVYQHPLNVGTYRIHCDNLNPIPALQDRLVKVSIERMHYPK